MIHESGPWKRQLLKDADLIERWAAKSRVNERRSILIETKIFVSAYAIRKLFEAEKLSSDMGGRNIKADRFNRLSDRKLTSMNLSRFNEVFDLTAPTARSVNLRDLLDTIIHSKLFAENLYAEDDHRISGFFVTSDKRDANLWLEL